MSENSPIPFEAAVLVGGRSRRMGRDKAMIPVGGEPLWHRQARLANEAGARRVFLSMRSDQHPEYEGFERVADAQPGLGPLSGIASALAACRTSHLLILAVDMPALTADLLRALIAKCGTGFGVIPHTALGAQPLAAIYTADCLALAQRRLAEGALSVRAWADECIRSGHCIPWEALEHDPRLFANWNAPGDLGATRF